MWKSQLHISNYQLSYKLQIESTALKPGKAPARGGFFCTVFYIACKRSSVIYRFLGVC